MTIYILNKHEMKSKFQYIQATKLMNSDVIHHLPKMTYNIVFGKLFIVSQNAFYSNTHCCRRILSYNRDVMTLRAENFELLNNLK